MAKPIIPVMIKPVASDGSRSKPDRLKKVSAVHAELAEAISYDIRNDYDSLLKGGIPFISALAQWFKISTGEIEKATRKLSKGIEHRTFSIPVMFHTKADPYLDVYVPVRKLELMSHPGHGLAEETDIGVLWPVSVFIGEWLIFKKCHIEGLSVTWHREHIFSDSRAKPLPGSADVSLTLGFESKITLDVVPGFTVDDLLPL